MCVAESGISIIRGTETIVRAHREQHPDDVDTVVVSAQLIRASDGSSVWSDQYEEPLESYMAVTRNIAELVVRELDVAEN